MTNLSMYVPHIWKSELDAEATAFLSKYYPDAIKKPMCVPIEHIATEVMHIKVVEHHLSEDLSILGQMCFTDGMAEIYDPVNDEYREIFVKAGTMIIDPDTYAKRNLGSKRNTMAHESYHWFRHRRYHLAAAQYAAEDKPVYRCPTVPKSENLQTEWTDEDWMEWQANNVAPRILMPIETVGAVYEKMAVESLKNAFVAKGLRPQSEWIIEQTAGFYMVSKQAAEIRLKELGYLS
ncbi:MAG: ImmA/IrrE family metallo-endopeptidase [Eubacterium sp.]|nr:ImmA/IrrE family metallo-endopeptidase [Eubacterium sp.]